MEQISRRTELTEKYAGSGVDWQSEIRAYADYLDKQPKPSPVKPERREYKEYIEQWIHEVKTPITAMKLLCENNRSPFSREVLAELENINQYTEQALYYARSEHAEKDYSVREVNLCDVVHSAIADNKYLLRQSNMSIQIDDIETKVYTDEKWVRFILNQIIGNAIKYLSLIHI